MNEEYKIVNETGGRYLILPVPDNPDELEMGMLMKLSGDAVITPKLLFDGEKSCMSFDISDCISLKGVIADKTLTESDIALYIAQLKNAADTLNNYLLGDENLLLDPDTIFVDKITSELRLCAYFSADIKDLRNTYIRQIIHEFLLGIDINNDKAVKLCMRLYREAEKDDCSLFDLVNEVLRDRNTSTILNDKPKKAAETVNEEKIYKAPETREKEISITDLDRDSYDDIYGNGIDSADYIYGDSDKINSDAEGTDNYHRKENIREEKIPMQYSNDGEKNTAGDVLIKIVITQVIMLIGIAAVGIFKGIPVVLRIMPIYGILAACTILYFTIGAWTERKKEAS